MEYGGQVSGVSRGWNSVSTTLAKNFTFKVETSICFFGLDRGLMLIKDEKMGACLLDKGEFWEEDVHFKLSK